MHYRIIIVASMIMCVTASLFNLSIATAQVSPSTNYRVYLPFIAGPRTPSQIRGAEVLALVNNERAVVGCAPVSLDDRLTSVAQAHSEDMSRNNFFSHTGSDGSTTSDRITKAGYQWSMNAENIAVSYPTAAEVMRAWMASEEHRNNILNCCYAHMGIGYVYEPNDTFPVPNAFKYYWTQTLARP